MTKPVEEEVEEERHSTEAISADAWEYRSGHRFGMQKMQVKSPPPEINQQLCTMS